MASDLLNIRPEKVINHTKIIKVIGVGGGGNNAVNHMYRQGIHDVDFIICNTDSQALNGSPVPVKVQLGVTLTEGRGAGNKPEIGKEAARESIEQVKQKLGNDTKMVFITAGMGGGTGTGGAPVIAELCHKMGFLTVGIVTVPFLSEGPKRFRQAIEGITELQAFTDSLLVINNERIREMYGDFPISEAFSKADDVLAIAAKGIAEIITVTSLVNVDYSDVETVMRKSGVAIMGTGVADGQDRAIKAVERALNSPLLNNNNIWGTRNVLLNVNSGEKEATMDEIETMRNYIQEKSGFTADIIWGCGNDKKLGEKISATVIATGFHARNITDFLSFEKNEKEIYTLEGNVISGREPSFSKSSSDVQNAGNLSEKPVAGGPGISKPKSVPDEFKSLYPNTAKQRLLKDISDTSHHHLSELADDEIDALEKTPAYLRKQIEVKDPNVKKSQISGVTVSVDEKKGVYFGLNKHLHSKVD